MTDTCYIPPAIAASLSGQDPFEAMMALSGKAFRDVKGRKTMRVHLAGEPYFIKQHFGVGWAEIFKNLLSFKLPIVSAKTEWQAIQKLDEIGIPTTPLVAYGERGNNPAKRLSFVMTKDLGDITSLEDFCAAWLEQPPKASFKRALIDAVAKLSQRMHGSGLNHRDFYLCHLCLDNQKLAQGDIYLYLIDLHRVGIRTHIRQQDRMKDLAGLYFSAMHVGLTHRDFLRYVRIYTGKKLRELDAQEWSFWRQVHQRALTLDVKFKKKVAAGIKL